jgi:hypothetical protein
MQKLILGVFDKYSDADLAYSSLVTRGFTGTDISVITRETTVKQIMDNTRDTAKGIAGAAATGGVVGGIVGILTGIGALTLPGIGALFIAGPIAALLGLSGAAALTASGALTGALAGGMVGVLKEVGLDEINAKVIEGKIKDGSVLLAVNCQQSEESMVKEIYKTNSADNVTSVDLEK